MKQRSYRSFSIYRDYGYNTEELLYRTNTLDRALEKFKDLQHTAAFNYALHLVETQVLEKLENDPPQSL